MDTGAKKHWETIYLTKKPEQVSWTEDIPSQSLEAISKLELPAYAHIADIGGGDSKLADHLLASGFENLTVVDISAAALERARQRLGPLAARVHWVESDIRDFVPEKPIDLWHDRAAFHFLTQPEDVQKYLSLLQTHVTGFVLLSTFSMNGPDKCSGLPVQRYGEASMCALLQPCFTKLFCHTYVHLTPAGAPQEFLLCCFRKQLN